MARKTGCRDGKTSVPSIPLTLLLKHQRPRMPANLNFLPLDAVSATDTDVFNAAKVIASYVLLLADKIESRLGARA